MQPIRMSDYALSTTANKTYSIFITPQLLALMLIAKFKIAQQDKQAEEDFEPILALVLEDFLLQLCQNCFLLSRHKVHPLSIELTIQHWWDWSTSMIWRVGIIHNLDIEVIRATDSEASGAKSGHDSYIEGLFDN